MLMDIPVESNPSRQFKKRDMNPAIPQEKIPLKPGRCRKRRLTAWFCLLVYSFVASGAVDGLLYCYDLDGRVMVESVGSVHCGVVPAAAPGLPTVLQAGSTAPSDCPSSTDPCGPCTHSSILTNGLLSYPDEELLSGQPAVLIASSREDLASALKPAGAIKRGALLSENASFTSLRSTVLLI